MSSKWPSTRPRTKALLFWLTSSSTKLTHWLGNSSTKKYPCTTSTIVNTGVGASESIASKWYRGYKMSTSKRQSSTASGSCSSTPKVAANLPTRGKWMANTTPHIFRQPRPGTSFLMSPATTNSCEKLPYSACPDRSVRPSASSSHTTRSSAPWIFWHPSKDISEDFYRICN